MTLTDLREIGFPRNVTRSKLMQLLSEKYPNHQWEKVYLLRGRFAKQQRLERAVASIFPVSIFFSLFSFFFNLEIFQKQKKGCRNKNECEKRSGIGKPRNRRFLGIGYLSSCTPIGF